MISFGDVLFYSGSKEYLHSGAGKFLTSKGDEDMEIRWKRKEMELFAPGFIER
jgi:hypothetical protein